MRISDWSSDVCSSDLLRRKRVTEMIPGTSATTPPQRRPVILHVSFDEAGAAIGRLLAIAMPPTRAAETGASWKVAAFLLAWWNGDECGRSEEHTSELQSLMRISYAVFCLKNKNTKIVTR